MIRVLRIEARSRDALAEAALQLLDEIDTHAPPGLARVAAGLEREIRRGQTAAEHLADLVEALDGAPGIEVEVLDLDEDGLSLALSIRVELPRAFASTRVAARMGELLLELLRGVASLTFAEPGLRLGSRTADVEEAQREVIHRAAERGVFLTPTIDDGSGAKQTASRGFGDADLGDDDDDFEDDYDNDLEDEDDDGFEDDDDDFEDDDDNSEDDDDFEDEDDIDDEGFPDGGFGVRPKPAERTARFWVDLHADEAFFLQEAGLAWPVERGALGKALRQLRLRHHPDRNPGCGVELTHLFARLTDGHRRLEQRLDQGRSA